MRAPYIDWLAFMRRIDIDRAWCVAICVSGREKAVQAEMAACGWSTYLPMLTTTIGDRKRRRKVNQPLLARYLFVAVNEGADPSTPKIDGLVAIRRAERAGASVVRLDVLAELMLTEVSHGYDLTWEQPRPPKGAFACGQTVTVRAGVLKGFDALILKVLGKRAVIAQYMLFGRVGQATFDVADLEAA